MKSNFLFYELQKTFCKNYEKAALPDVTFICVEGFHPSF